MVLRNGGSPTLAVIPAPEPGSIQPGWISSKRQIEWLDGSRIAAMRRPG